MSSNNALSLYNITHTLRNGSSLNVPRLSLDMGKIYGLFGDNGSGKTEILEIVADEENIKNGSVKFAAKKLKNDMVCLVEQKQFNFHFATGNEVLNYFFDNDVPLSVLGAAAYFGLALGLPVDMYTPAHKYLLQLLKVYQTNCKVMLIDEPTGLLDRKTVTRVKHFFEFSIFKQRVTIIASVDNEFLTLFCDGFLELKRNGSEIIIAYTAMLENNKVTKL